MAKPTKITDTRDKYCLRFHEEGLRDQLKARADANSRTLNAELLFLIKAGIEAVDKGKKGRA